MKTLKLAFGAILAPFELPYIKEWLEWHFKLGFDKAYIWLNDWPTESLAYLQQTYFGGEVIFHICNGTCLQLPAYNEIISTALMDNIDWLAIIDGDEFITMRSDKSINELLESRKSNTYSLAVSWRLFGSNGKKFISEEKDGVVKTFTRCAKDRNQHVKQIINLTLFKDAGAIPCFYADPHHINAIANDVDGNQVKGPWNKANLDKVHEIEINHYVTKSVESFLKRRSYRRADAGTPRPDLEKFWQEHDVNEIDASELDINNL